jgi:hypothetical protein
LINIFRVGAFYKYIFLFLVFLAIRLPALIYGVPWLMPELNWTLVAERMSEGYPLYTQIWDSVSPLSALTFWLIHEAFGKSALAHQVIATLLIFIQAVTFNQILQNQRVYLEITLIPALLYGVLMSTFLDFYILSPPLLANTFLLLVIRYMFVQVGEKRQSMVFEIGAYIGLATLFYLPSFLLMIVPVLGFILFTGSKLRDYLLMLFSFLFTLSVAFLGFYFTDSEYEFYLSFFAPLFNFSPYFLLNFAQMGLLFALPLALVVFNFLKAPQYRRYTNYQNRCQTIMNLWVIVALLTIFLSDKISAYSFALAIPAIVFLLTHYFLMLKSALLAELVFTILLGLNVFFTYTTLYQTPLRFEIPFTNWGTFNLNIQTDRLIAQPLAQANTLKGRKILVMGNNMSSYLTARAATPYLDWQLSQRHFDNMDKYNILITIFQNFQKDLPEIIVDENGNAQKVFQKIPLLAQKYEAIPNSNLFRLKAK